MVKINIAMDRRSYVSKHIFGDNSNYISESGTLVFEPETNRLFLHDGVTLGGSEIGYQYNTAVIKSEADFPAPSGGVIQLADNTLYIISGTVTTSNTLQYGVNTMVSGNHYGRDTLVYTGTGSALKSTNNAFFLRFLVVVAPNGKVIDVSASSTTELYVFLCAVINCTSIGTIDGYRVPVFDSVSFETFDNGLQFTGTSTKIFVKDSVFRDAQAGANAIEIDATCTTEIADIRSNYFRNFNATATCIQVDNIASVTQFGIVTGNAVDNSITQILSGVGPESLKWTFRNNQNIRDSRIVGSINMDGNATATVLTLNTWTKVAGTTVTDLLERFTHPQSNRLTYADERDIEANVSVTCSMFGSVANQVIEAAIYKNGLIESVPMTSVLVGPGSARADIAIVQSLVAMSTTDYVELWVRCTSGSNNVTVASLQFIVTA